MSFQSSAPNWNMWLARGQKSVRLTIATTVPITYFIAGFGLRRAVNTDALKLRFAVARNLTVLLHRIWVISRAVQASGVEHEFGSLAAA